MIWLHSVDNSFVHLFFQKPLWTLIVLTLIPIVVACTGSLPTDSTSLPITNPTIANPTPTSGIAEGDTSKIESEQAAPVVPWAPVFSVSTVDGENLRLDDLLGSVPVYLVFIPTSTDPTDRSQMSRIQAQIDSFEKLETEVVVVVSDLPTRVVEMRDELSLGFALIADPLNVISGDWQVFDGGNDGSATPASFVFDALGTLVARLVAAEPDDRPSVVEVLNVIEESLSTGAL